MIPIIDKLNLDDLPENSKHIFKLNLIKNPLGDHWHIPIMVAKGSPGKVMGITAAIHGNELNGIQTIHCLWQNLQLNELQGTLVLCPVVNVPGFINGTREFYDGRDLNRVMPGKKHGAGAERYVYEVTERLTRCFDFHLDLHTASEGRINSFYIKANCNNATTLMLAKILHPEIIVNTPGPKGSYRATCEAFGIPSLTLELGDPNLFQQKHIQPAYDGLLKALGELKMLNASMEKKSQSKKEIVMCSGSKWLYTKHGGMLTVHPDLTDHVKKGDVIAGITDVYGTKVVDIKANRDGVVIGKAMYPVCQEGARIIHLGEVTN